ncbi:predicted protein [Arabidopsis lyrata subsp. lyrata]|uniref:Predicted protein n=1 Tax=Arabidopsis lyrata subsp. lyrata TaxID=81972 RepID=D7LY01_ARALL|nr:predicted protein [Arabidopsis lyrata subsp. lyrata]
MAYKDSINPFLAISSLYGLPEDIASMNLLPSHTKRTPGRPKKKTLLLTQRGSGIRNTSLATFSYTKMYPMQLDISRRKGCEDRMFSQDARVRGTTGPLAACPYRGM